MSPMNTFVCSHCGERIGSDETSWFIGTCPSILCGRLTKFVFEED